MIRLNLYSEAAFKEGSYIGDGSILQQHVNKILSQL